jgi:type VI secretion system protein ImpK
MTGPFSDLVGPVLEHVVAFQEAVRGGELPALDPERRSLMRLLDDAEKRAAAAPDLARDYALARYTVVYLVDEILITTPWPHASAWKNAILELHYFGPPRRAAEDFWVRADQAEAQARDGKGTDPLETFYLCAALGFRGELILDQPQLLRWFDRIYPLIYAGLPGAEDAQDGESVWGLSPLKGGRLLVVVSALVSGTAVLTALTFIAAVHARGY